MRRRWWGRDGRSSDGLPDRRVSSKLKAEEAEGKQRKNEKEEITPRAAEKEKQESNDGTDAGSSTPKRKQHAALVDAGCGDGDCLPGGHGACVFLFAQVFSKQARRAQTAICNERAAHGESFCVYGRIDAGRDSEIAGAGERAGAAAQDRKRTRGTDGTAERRSDAEHAGRPAGGECDGDYFVLESGGGASAGNSRAGIPAVQRSAGRGLGLDEAGGGVPFDGKDLPARRSGAHSPGGRYAASGRDDFADPARHGKHQRRDLSVDGFDGACGVAATDAAEGKPGRAGRAVRGHRARVQECAGDNFRLCAADSGGIGKGCFGVCGAHPAADEGYYARSGRVSKVREAVGDSG